MPVPGNPESGGFSGQDQAQQQSIKFSGAVPIKKRRVPMIESSSPSPEEKPFISEDKELKNKQDHKIPDEGLSSSDARNMVSLGHSDVSKASSITVKKETTPSNIQLGQTNVDTFASKVLESKPSTSSGPVDDLGIKKDIFHKKKPSELANVKQETVSGKTEVIHGLEFSTGKMNAELSLGPKEPLGPALKHHRSAAITNESGKSDSSLLSLALHGEHDKNDSITGNDRSLACANRSNWDLNSTMDVWEGSSSCDGIAHKLVDSGRFSKTTSSLDDKSTLTTAGTIDLGSDKGEHIFDGQDSSYSSTSESAAQQSKADDSLRLGLAMPYMDVGRERPSLSENFVCATTRANLILKPLQLSITNANRTVKSEPVDDNSKRDCSVGSSSSSSMESSKFSSVKKESLNNTSLETILESSTCLEKLVDYRSIKSEVVQECNREASMSEDAVIPRSIGRVMLHQESCASSSALPVPLIRKDPCLSWLPTCSELTTSGDLSTQSKKSSHNEELHYNDISNAPIATMVSKPVCQDIEQLKACKAESLSVVDLDKRELACVNEQMHELSKNSEVPEKDEEKANTSPEMLEADAAGSDSESQQNCDVDTLCDKEDEEYEDGEVREPIQHSAGEGPVVERKKIEKLELLESNSRNFELLVPSADKNINLSDFEEKDAVKIGQEETHSNPNEDFVVICSEPDSEDNSLKKLSDKVLEVLAHDKRSICVSPDEQLVSLGKDIQDNLGRGGLTEVQEIAGKEVLTDVPSNGSHGIGVEPGDGAIKKVIKENCSREECKVEASLNGHDADKDSNYVGNKRRIINLSRASAVTSPCKTKYIPNRLLTSRSGKERYSGLDGEMQQRGNRDEFYTGGSIKFVKDRVHDQSLRNSRPKFLLGKGRISGRFGSSRNEWDSDHDFTPENSYAPSDYRVIRRRHNSSISDVDLECNGYGVQQDGSAFGGNRKKMMNEEFPSTRRTSFGRLSSGDRDGPITRGVPILHRVPRNMSPRRSPAEASSDMIGLRHDDNFMRLSDEIIDPDYDRPQAMYNELDGQLVRGNRNFSPLQRKGYPRVCSKSPVRSRTRSPGPWSSPRRRSPNGLAELTQHRSPDLYRMGRMRSPDRACFHDEMVARRHGSPSYIPRHTNDLRDADSGIEHVHCRSADSKRRSSPGRVFPRNARRGDVLDSREMGDADEYVNGPLPSNKFHEIRGDGGIDERRKFIERRGPLRPFRQSYTSDNDNFRFHLNDGPRPYRFCPHPDTEFVERNNMREREFDGRMKNQPMVVSRRIRNIEEQHDGNYRPVERVWHDDGFSDDKVKRRRF